MFVILLRYIRPLSAVMACLDEHNEFLARHYAAGHFLVSGPQIPREGGVILAMNLGREELDAVLAEDPFYREKIAEFQVIAFEPKMQAAGLEALLQPES